MNPTKPTELDALLAECDRAMQHVQKDGFVYRTIQQMRAYITAAAPHADKSEYTCKDCGASMRFNVPRLGANGGFVHAESGQFLCTSPAPQAQEPVTCESCNGKGKRYWADSDGNGSDEVVCQQCNGNGKLYAAPPTPSHGALSVPEWLPIETAPREVLRTIIMGYAPDEENFSPSAREGYWSHYHDRWLATSDPTYLEIPQPTHWMPLPAAPQSAPTKPEKQ